jgi:diacylglycerol O-acyltransferase / wax synthase
MSAVDHAWYRMDTPANLMMVHAIMWTDQPLDWARFRGEVGERMLVRFPKFRDRPVPARTPFGRAGWEEDREFDLDRHLLVHRLAPPGDRPALAAYISGQIPTPPR